MKSIEANIGNFKQSLYGGIILYSVFYLYFYGDPYDNDVVLTYAQEIKYKNTEEVDESCVEALENYIETRIMIRGKDYIVVLTKVIGRKKYHSGNLFGYANKNPSLDTIFCELEFRNGSI